MSKDDLMKPKLRISYSILNYWRTGRIDDLIITYFKLADITNPFMEAGKKFDEYTNKYVMENKCLPPELGGGELVSPQTQDKWESDFEKYSLVGVPDIVDGDTLYEIKTGNSKDSGDYSMDFQVAIYLLLAELLGKPITKAWILHYNQYKDTLDKTLIWNTPEERERAKNFIQTLAPEIWQFFTDNEYPFDGKMPIQAKP